MVVTHWEMINGSPKRTWRYMTNIYDQSEHWWESMGTYGHVVIRRPDNYTGKIGDPTWHITIYRANAPTFSTDSYWPLRKIQQSITHKEDKRNAT